VTMTLEPDPVERQFVCRACSRDFLRVIGYVYQDESPLAVYHADLYSEHPHREPIAVLTISVGDWSDDADPKSRRRARIEAWPRGNEIVMRFAGFSPGEDASPLLGEPLASDEAREARDRDLYLRVADLVAYRDRRVARALRTEDAGD
jgi:hypothetical protein